MQKMTFVALLGYALITTTAGCVSAPTKVELANADYGTPINQEDAEHRAKKFMSEQTDEPDSTTYMFAPIEKSWNMNANYTDLVGKVQYGYLLRSEVLRLRKSGGRKKQEHLFVFRDGQVVSAHRRMWIKGPGFGSTVRRFWPKEQH